MKSPYERRIARASFWIENNPEPLLLFYRELAKLQGTIFDEPHTSDFRSLVPHFAPLIALTASRAPQLHEFATEHLATVAAQTAALEQRWEGYSQDLDARAYFFAQALIEPFAMKLALRGQPDPQWSQPVCPFCQQPPGVAVLRSEGDGGKRWLKCSLCSTEWQFRRILCPNCGEEDKEKLPVYIAKEFEHVRVEACDACKTYIKSIDLTKNGLADPVVDEIVTVPLNIWAERHGYVKLAPNLMGM